VSAVDWTEYAGRVELVSGGSPCQDLSVAGKRAGLEGARSGLFFELIRAWDETRAPYCLWENVDGARSSNKGASFAAVLSAFVGGPVPVAGRWASAGVAAGPTGVAAWRVLDLQFFGPPQRRRRVFVLAARAGGCDPAEILAVSESVCGHPAPRERTREGAARGARAGVAFGINSDSRAEVVADGVAPLRAGQRQQANVMTFAERGRSDGRSVEARTDGVVNSLLTPNGGRSGTGAGDAVLAMSETGKGFWTPGEPLAGLRADPGGMPSHVLAFHHTQDPISGRVSPSIGRTTDGMGVLCTTGPVTHALTAEGCDASEDGTGRGTPIVTPTLNMGAHTAAPGSNGQDALEWAAITVPLVGRPRRLTPLECERLMSWPDTHTAEGIREDGTRYALSDTARYRLCGNGVGSVVAAWIGRRLMWAEANTPTLTTP
jgi:DNA (cytosine-5)-methyltransferase 1